MDRFCFCFNLLWTSVIAGPDGPHVHSFLGCPDGDGGEGGVTVTRGGRRAWMCLHILVSMPVCVCVCVCVCMICMTCIA